MMTYYLGDAAKEYGGWVAYDGTLTRAEEFTPKAMEDLRRNWATLARQNIEVQKLVVHALTPNLAIAAFSGRNSLTDKAGKTTDWSLSVMTALWVKHEGAWRIAEQHQSFQPAPK
jgi:ketosteroid isomerase-like protein